MLCFHVNYINYININLVLANMLDGNIFQFQVYKYYWHYQWIPIYKITSLPNYCQYSSIKTI